MVSLSSNAIQSLMQLSDLNSSRDAIELTATVRGEIRGLLNGYISHLLGRRPRMYGYLTQLR